MILNSLLDNDLYKYTQQNAVLELFPDAQVEYRFKNRGKQRFNEQFLIALKKGIKGMSLLRLKDHEYEWLKENCPYLKRWYLEYLKNYQFNPDQVEVSLDNTNDLVLNIKGLWCETILYEVPLMAMISEIYFEKCDKNWNYEGQEEKINKNFTKLLKNSCSYADFGTRRRRSFQTQDLVVKNFTRLQKESKVKTWGFKGTSNVHLAMKYGVKPIGTVSHEFFMGISVLEGLRHANYFAMYNWAKIFGTSLGIILTDTYKVDNFLKNFNRRFAMLFEGTRHDSGDWKEFTDKIIQHYKNLKINPLHKIIVFSDGLNVDKAIGINNYCKNKIQCSFGIGTYFTNSFSDSSALNMVIKMWSCEGIPVVKLSDSPGKETGDEDSIRVAKWTFLGEKL